MGQTKRPLSKRKEGRKEFFFVSEAVNLWIVEIEFYFTGTNYLRSYTWS